MQGNRRFFSVTAIFLGHFLTNMPKFQKFHFFLRRIYIIIEGRTEPRNVFRGVIPAVMGRETPSKRFQKPKRYRERSQIPAKNRTNGLAPYRYRKKGENTMVNKVRVNIAGTPYAIATTDSEKYILGLAKKLDEDITKLLDTNDNLSVTKAAVFCAMDYLDEYRKSTGSAENMRSQIQDYIADAARAKLAEDKVRTENETLRRENDALREQLARLQAKQKADREAKTEA